MFFRLLKRGNIAVEEIGKWILYLGILAVVVFAVRGFFLKFS